MNDQQRQVKDTGRDIERMEKRERDPVTMRSLLVYGGMAGLLFIVPIVLGAYLGRWFDSITEGYSVRWTVSLIILGIVVGAYNVYHFMRKHT